MKKLLMVGFLILTGCVTNTAPVVMTDQHIADASDAALCSLSKTNPDPRIDAEMQSRNVDCEPAALVCAAKGIKKGTKKFVQCKEDQQIQKTVSAHNNQHIAATAKQEPACGFMQEFFGGVDCRQEQMNQRMRNCQSLDNWGQRSECKSDVIAAYSKSPYAGELAAYSRVIIEKVKAHKMTEAEAEYAIQQKAVEINQRIAEIRASDRQLDLIEREQDMREHQERRERMNETIQQNNDRMMETIKNNQQNTTTPAPVYTSPTTTNCEPDGYGGMRCTTY